MSLAELLPDVRALTRDDKLRLMQALAEELGQAEDFLAISSGLDAGLEPDSDLTDEERASRDLGIARGDADFAAGRFRSLDEIKADKRTRFGLNV